MILGISINELKEQIQIRTEELLKEHLVESKEPPSVELLARYMAEEVTKILVEEAENPWMIEQEVLEPDDIYGPSEYPD